MHRCVKSLLIILFALTQIMSGSRGVLAHDVGLSHRHDEVSGLQMAQFQYERDQQWPENGQDSDIRIDVEPPLIEHDVNDEAEADIRQNFVATVVDDEELDSVLFFYRYAGETSFSRYLMMQVSFSSTYIAQIPTDPDSYTPIEYYIQARDTSGNRTVRGYAFSPLVRNIVPRVAVADKADAMVGGTLAAPRLTFSWDLAEPTLVGMRFDGLTGAGAADPYVLELTSAELALGTSVMTASGVAIGPGRRPGR